MTAVTDVSTVDDVIDAALGAAAAPVSELRASRPDVRRHTQAAYQARLFAGLALLAGMAKHAAPEQPASEQLASEPGAQDSAGAQNAEKTENGESHPFTLDQLTWSPWVESVAADALTLEQQAVI